MSATTKFTSSSEIGCEIDRPFKGMDGDVCDPFGDELVGKDAGRGGGHYVETRLIKGM